jgi:subtilisin family serine protease
MNDPVCLSIRFVPVVSERAAAILYGKGDDKKAQLESLLHELNVFVQKLGFEVTATGAATMCIRGTAEQFKAVFNTAPPKDGWSGQGLEVVDQRALDAVAARLPGFIRDIALQRSSEPVLVGSWPPPVPGAGCLGLLQHVPALLDADLVHAQNFMGDGVTVTVLDLDFDFEHQFFDKREVRCRERLVANSNAASGQAPATGHGTAMAALVAAVAPEADIVGISLRDGVLLEGLTTALDGTEPLPDILSISLTRDMCDRSAAKPWTELPIDLEHVASEINLAVANGVSVVTGAGNGEYGFPAAMKQVISVAGVQVDGSQVMSAWEGASAFRSAITSGDCKDRFVPDISGLAGRNRGAYIVLPVPPGSAYEQSFPVGSQAAGGGGWALFSGSSAATAQVAGVCALVLQKEKLSPRRLKNLLCNTAKRVNAGTASPLSNLGNALGLSTATGASGAAGFGLVNAHQAWSRADDEDWTRALRPR